VETLAGLAQVQKSGGTGGVQALRRRKKYRAHLVEFGDGDVIRSCDLVAELTADLERSPLRLVDKRADSLVLGEAEFFARGKLYWLSRKWTPRRKDGRV
jgi:hypothetical protein